VMADVPEFKIARLELKPGDVVVLKYDGKLSECALAHVQRALRETFPPGQKTLVIEAGFELSVMAGAEAPE
jgi:hypothetical protein